MRQTLFILLALIAAPACGDEWVVPKLPAVPAAAESPAVDVTTFVYPIRMRTSRGTSQGGAVSVGGGTLQTVWHLEDQVGSGTCEVQVNGVWKPATFRAVDRTPAGDVALARVSGDLAAPPRRAPKYGERVVVYGLKTGFLQCGFISGPRHVALDASEKGTLSGDSGGGVFSEAGEFLGTVQGSDSKENRVVVFRPNDFEINFAGPTATPASKPVASAATPPGMVCENGVCRLQSPVPSQQPAQNGHWEQRVGLFGRTHMVWVPNR